MWTVFKCQFEDPHLGNFCLLYIIHFIYYIFFSVFFTLFYSYIYFSTMLLFSMHIIKHFVPVCEKLYINTFYLLTRDAVCDSADGGPIGDMFTLAHGMGEGVHVM